MSSCSISLKLECRVRELGDGTYNTGIMVEGREGRCVLEHRVRSVRVHLVNLLFRSVSDGVVNCELITGLRLHVFFITPDLTSLSVFAEGVFPHGVGRTLCTSSSWSSTTPAPRPPPPPTRWAKSKEGFSAHVLRST